ncbi:MAG: class I SAM-dependent methyltransferase [Acidimicrobiales bacterium]
MTPSGQRSAGSWRSYLDWFHERRPGITEDILADADNAGASPYRWVLDAAPGEGLALDVACGSGPLQLIGSGHRWVGIDRSTGELARAARQARSPLVRGDSVSLPFPDDTFDLVVCSMALMLFDPVDAALAEIRRVLHAGGAAVFLLPGSFPLTTRDRARYIRVLAALHELQPAYPNRIHLGRLATHLARAGFKNLEDDRRRFHYPLSDERASLRFVESLYAPGHPPEHIEAAARVAARWVGSEIGIPLRRIVCQKQTT